MPGPIFSFEASFVYTSSHIVVFFGCVVYIVISLCINAYNRRSIRPLLKTQAL